MGIRVRTHTLEYSLRLNTEMRILRKHKNDVFANDLCQVAFANKKKLMEIVEEGSRVVAH